MDDVVDLDCPVCGCPMSVVTDRPHYHCRCCCMVCGKQFKDGDDILLHVTGLYRVHKGCVSEKFNTIFWWDDVSLKNYVFRYHVVPGR